MNVADQLKVLYDAQLYDDVKSLGSMLLTLSDHNPELLTVSVRFQVMVYYADAIYSSGCYKKAECLYKQSLQLKKLANKSKGKGQTIDVGAEVDVKYKIHLCLVKLKQNTEAIVVLDSINGKQRTARVNLALGKLHHRFGNDRAAVTAYKEVLRECPLSLQATKGLLCLGVKGAEVASLMMNVGPGTASLDWLSLWTKAHAFSASLEYCNAVQTFRVLDVKPILRDNLTILCSMGESQFLQGDYSGALATLKRVHSLDHYTLTHMDILAYLLREKEKDVKELERLGTQLMSVTDEAAEPWVAMGYFCLATHKPTRAIFFAQKAFTLDNQCVEALLLKGTGLLELKRVEDAILHFREAIHLAPNRYEAHKGLVDCYVSMDRVREAITLTGQAYKQLGTNARTLTLYASVLAKDTLNLEKAKRSLERAMKLDPQYLDAVYLMANILMQQTQYEEGLKLLRQALEHHSTCMLHTMLAHFLNCTNEHQQAMDEYSIALGINPTYARARAGLERTEKQVELGLSGTYDLDVEDVEASNSEVDGDSSDMDGAWQDIDLNHL